MKQYLHNKMYNIPYGDLVPLILANALNITIVTISEGAQATESRIIHANTGDEAAGKILVYKLPEHYDCITPKRESPQLPLV